MGKGQKLRIVIITAIITILIAGVIAFFFFRYVDDRHKDVVSILYDRRVDAEVFSFSKDLEAGHVLTEDDITTIQYKEYFRASGMYLIMEGSYFTDTIKDSMHYHYIATTDRDGNIVDEHMIPFDGIDELVGRVIKINVTRFTPILDSLLIQEDVKSEDKELEVEELKEIFGLFQTEDGIYKVVLLPNGEMCFINENSAFGEYSKVSTGRYKIVDGEIYYSTNDFEKWFYGHGQESCLRIIDNNNLEYGLEESGSLKRYIRKMNSIVGNYYGDGSGISILEGGSFEFENDSGKYSGKYTEKNGVLSVTYERENDYLPKKFLVLDDSLIVYEVKQNAGVFYEGLKKHEN